MKFEELKLSLKEKINYVYVLSGVDEYLLSSSYNLICKYSGVVYEDLNIIQFSEGVIDCDDVVRALNTMPVFSDKKIVYLDLRMSKKSELKNVKKLNDYLESPNDMAILVVNLGASDEDFGLEKKLLNFVDCNRLDIKIVQAKINAVLKGHGKAIESSAMVLLIEYCLGDLAKILVECSKLVAFVGERETISSSDIKEIVTRSVEYQIFELTESLAKKNSTRVFAILQELKAKKDEYKMLPALIYSHFRRLFQVSLNQKISNAEIAKMLGIKESAVKMTQNQVKLFSKSALKKINKLCTDLDYDLKQSNISLENAIDLIVLSILNM